MQRVLACKARSLLPAFAKRFGVAQVSLWRVDAQAFTDEAFRTFEAFLSPDERARARALEAIAARRWVIFRGALRAILGERLACDPRDVVFTYGANGKPRIASPNTDLQFNLAHTDDFAFIALSAGFDVGIDVERIDHGLEFQAIGATAFSPVEQLELAMVPEASRCAAFYAGWTRREAILKVLGAGFGSAAPAFDVSLRPERARQTIACDWRDSYQLVPVVDLDLGDRFAGALAIEDAREEIEVTSRDFTLRAS